MQEHLSNLKNLALQELVVATSEQEMYRLQGKLRLVGMLEQLPSQVKEAIERKNEG
jgi:undecaprenyl pyrophosphate synthase